MSKVSFNYEKYEEIGTLKGLKELYEGLKAFSKESLRTTPILIYIDNPDKIILYSKVEK